MLGLLISSYYLFSRVPHIWEREGDFTFKWEEKRENLQRVCNFSYIKKHEFGDGL